MTSGDYEDSMQITIVGTDLPGRDCPAGHKFCGYTDVHVGVQRRGRPDELLDPQPADLDVARWSIDARITGTDIADLLGSHIQGPPGGRFVYLTWLGVDPNGSSGMFRRAKIMLSDIPPQTFADALDTGHLHATLGLTDSLGQPLCARVKPGRVSWSTSPVAT